MSENLDDLIICPKCNTIHKKVCIPNEKVAVCSVCKEKLYSNVKDIFNKSLAFSITALILFFVSMIFPIIKVYILGIESDLTIIKMIYTLFDEGFFIIGSIILVVVVISPLIVLSSFILLALLSHFKIFKSISRNIISFLIVSRNWAMVDIFAISILVALVKLFGYAEVKFGVAFVSLFLFVVVDLLFLKSIKPIELWTYCQRMYDERR